MTDPKLARVFADPFGEVEANYAAKVERKGRTRAELVWDPDKLFNELTKGKAVEKVKR